MKPLLLLPLATLLTGWLAAAEAPRPIVLRELPLLFADESGVAAKSGVVRTVHPARQRSAPVLEPEQPWESDRVYVYGSVYRDEKEGLFRLWYLSRLQLDKGIGKDGVPGFRTGKFDVDVYATSRDGLKWERPPLALHPYRGATDTNIIFDLHSPSVLLDPRDEDPARRYKMLGSYSGGYHAAISPDGLNWSRYPDGKPILNGSDNITLTQDPATGEYLAYLRGPLAKLGRTISLSRSTDFKTWSPPELVFAPDAEDNAWVKNEGERTEVNNMAVYPHAAGFLGLPTIFRVLAVGAEPSNLATGQSSTDGIVEVQLVTSADGRHWARTQPRVSVIARGARGSFDGGTILGVSSTYVDAGDESWVYYTGLTTSHGGPIPPKRISIGRAEWRRHGFVSLDAGQRAQVETKPLALAWPNLVVNADATGGELRVALLEADGTPIAGLSLDESEPLQSDATRWRVRWHSSTVLPTDRPVRVVVKMTQARLFSLSSAP